MSSLLTLHICGVHDAVAARYLKHIDEPRTRPYKCMVSFERTLSAFDACDDWREVQLEELVCETCDGGGIVGEDRPGHVTEYLGCPDCRGEKLYREVPGE